MKKHCYLVITCTIALLAAVAQAAPYDTFTGPLMDRSKWKDLEQGVQLAEQKLKLTIRAPGSGIQSISMANPETVTSMRADVAFTDFTLEQGDETHAEAGVAGIFYKSGDRDVFANINMEYTGDAATPNTVTFVAMLMYWPSMEDIAEQEFTFTAAVGDEITMLLIYDGDNGFTFEVGPASTGFFSGDEIVVLNGPAKDASGEPTQNIKLLHANAWSGPDANEVLIQATFDNIYTNAFLYDDFNTPLFPDKPNLFIDDTKWIQDKDWPGQDPDDFSSPWVSRRINNNSLELTVQNIGLDKVTMNTDIPVENHTNFLQADVTIDPATYNSGFDPDAPQKDRSQVRLQAFHFNALHDGSAANPYNGEEGEIYIMVRTETRATGDNFVRALMGQCDNADCTESTDLLSSGFSCEVNPGSPNTLSLKKAGNTYFFSCDGETVTHTYSGNMYDSQWGDIRRIRARVYTTPDQHGYLKAYVDNIYTATTNPWNLYLPAILTRPEQPGL